MIDVLKNNAFWLSKKSLSVLLFVTVILLFSYYIYDNAHRLSHLLNLSLFSIISILSLTTISLLNRGIISYVLYGLFSVNISLLEGGALAVMSTLGNLLPFSGGLVAKGVYLKKRYKLAYGHYFPATVSLFVVFLGVNGLIGSVGLLCLTDVFHAKNSTILFFAFNFMLLSFNIIWIPLPLRLFPKKLQQWLKNIKKGWQELGRNKMSLFFYVYCR